MAKAAPALGTIDATSIDAYDLHDESVTLAFGADVIALNWTQWRVAQFDTPAARLESVTVNVVGFANSGGVVADLLNADIGTKYDSSQSGLQAFKLAAAKFYKDAPCTDPSREFIARELFPLVLAAAFRNIGIAQVFRESGCDEAVIPAYATMTEALVAASRDERTVRCL
jgi:hypothetical protein